MYGLTQHSVQIVAVICVILGSRCATGGFLTRPQNTTVYQGEWANFSCAVTVDRHWLILWYITEDYILPGLLPEEYDAQVSLTRYGNAWLESTLNISTTNITNNTLIECKGDSTRNPDIFSDAVLSVQGKLEKVPSLSSVVANDSVLLVWEAPYTLPGTKMHFIIKAELSAPASISRSVVTPHTNHTFSFVELNIDPDHGCGSNYSIEFSVAGVNPVGVGDWAFAAVTVLQDTDQCSRTQEDLIDIIASGVATGSVLIVLLCAVSIMLCVAIGYRRAKNCNSARVECNPRRHMTLNGAYVGTYPMIRNKAYEPVKEPPHTYEEMDLEPKNEISGVSKKGNID